MRILKDNIWMANLIKGDIVKIANVDNYIFRVFNKDKNEFWYLLKPSTISDLIDTDDLSYEIFEETR